LFYCQCVLYVAHEKGLASGTSDLAHRDIHATVILSVVEMKVFTIDYFSTYF